MKTHRVDVCGETLYLAVWPESRTTCKKPGLEFCIAWQMALLEEIVWFVLERDDDEEWSEMFVYRAFEVERLFRCSKHHYSEFENYLYEFTEMIQINRITGRRRPIRRRVRFVHLDVR